MKNLKYLLLLITVALSGCATDLSQDVHYAADSNLGLTLEGQIVAVRNVVIKDNDSSAGNLVGAIAGGVLGNAVGGNIGKGGGKQVARAGGTIGGALLGAGLADKLSKTKGHEYTVKVDTSNITDEVYGGTPSLRKLISAARANGLITVVQADKVPLMQGQNVFVIFSDNKVKIIPS